MARGGSVYQAFMDGRKRDLLGSLTGTVVEIGSGTGPNLRYLPPGVRVVGIEPNPHMHGYFLREARTERRGASLVRGVAESLPFPDESVDAVLATLVLCSVSDLDQVLGEVLRVLKPGGRFLFVEHVAAPDGTWLRRIQGWVRPVWSAVGDGCEPDRNTEENLRNAGFREVRLDRFSVPLLLVSPHIAGVAEK
jgi:ubiquinone/menaquinone biosynthesis C-methylase UbiE